MWTHDGACGSHGVPHSGAVSVVARSPALRPRPDRSLRLHRKDRQRRRGAALRVLVRGMAGFFLIIGIACCAAANELTASDVEYLRTITPSQTPRFLRDMTPAEARCMHELINRPGEENERRTIVSAFVGWIVLGQVTGDRTPPQTCHRNNRKRDAEATQAGMPERSRCSPARNRREPEACGDQFRLSRTAACRDIRLPE